MLQWFTTVKQRCGEHTADRIRNGLRGGADMSQRICPVCDHVMTSAHYCKTCKSWVRHPHIMERSFYLNERHPEQEQGCTYHNEMKQGESGAWRPAGMSKTVPPKTAVPPRAAVPPKTAVPPGTAASAKTPVPPGQPLPPMTSLPPRIPLPSGDAASQRGKPERGRLGIVALLCVAALISTLISNMTKPSDRYDTDPGDYMDEGTEAYYQALEDEEVLNRGEDCNSRGHFAIQGEFFEAQVQRILREAGYQITRQDTYSYNEVQQDGATWFATWITIEVEGHGESGYQYVELDSDTGTGKLHEINLSLDDPDRLTEVTGAILRALAQEGEFSDDTERITRMTKELSGALVSGEDYYLLEGPVQIEGISYEESYTVYISHNIDSDL